MRLSRVACLLCLLAITMAVHAQRDESAARTVDPHQTAEWQLVAPHLPNPVTAPPQELEMAADVLRARRFPEDALLFYRAAMLNGGDRARLLKKQGVLQLELQRGVLAHLDFEQATRMNKRDASAWNNLGAADFMLGNTRGSIREYKHALKLERASAVFHSNLALAYFEDRSPKKARQELGRALALDPEILHHSSEGGYNLQVLASTHYADICFEMARVSAGQGDREATISWLTKAAERGLDVHRMLRDDALLSPYLQEERVRTMLANNEQLRVKTGAPRVKAPGLGSAVPLP